MLAGIGGGNRKMLAIPSHAEERPAASAAIRARLAGREEWPFDAEIVGQIELPPAAVVKGWLYIWNVGAVVAVGFGIALGGVSDEVVARGQNVLRNAGGWGSGGGIGGSSTPSTATPSRGAGVGQVVGDVGWITLDEAPVVVKRNPRRVGGESEARLQEDERGGGPTA